MSSIVAGDISCGTITTTTGSISSTSGNVQTRTGIVGGRRGAFQILACTGIKNFKNTRL